MDRGYTCDDCGQDTDLQAVERHGRYVLRCARCEASRRDAERTGRIWRKLEAHHRRRYFVLMARARGLMERAAELVGVAR